MSMTTETCEEIPFPQENDESPDDFGFFSCGNFLLTRLLQPSTKGRAKVQAAPHVGAELSVSEYSFRCSPLLLASEFVVN